MSESGSYSYSSYSRSSKSSNKSNNQEEEPMLNIKKKFRSNSENSTKSESISHHSISDSGKKKTPEENQPKQEKPKQEKQEKPKSETKNPSEKFTKTEDFSDASSKSNNELDRTGKSPSRPVTTPTSPTNQNSDTLRPYINHTREMSTDDGTYEDTSGEPSFEDPHINARALRNKKQNKSHETEKSEKAADEDSNTTQKSKCCLLL